MQASRRRGDGVSWGCVAFALAAQCGRVCDSCYVRVRPERPRIVRSDELFTEKVVRRRVPMVLPLVKWLRAVTRLFGLRASVGGFESEAAASLDRLEAARRQARAVLESRQRRLSRMQALGDGVGQPAEAEEEVCRCVAKRGCPLTLTRRRGGCTTLTE